MTRRGVAGLVLVFMLCALPTSGEVGVRVKWDASPGYDPSYNPERLGGEHRTFRYESFGWEVMARHERGRQAFTAKLTYSRSSLLRATLSDRPTKLPRWNLYSLISDLHWERQWSRSSSHFTLSPRYENGAESSSKRDDFKLGYRFLMTLPWRSFRLGGGLDSGWAFGDRDVTPVLALSWESNAKPLWISVVAPLQGEIGFAHSDWLTASAQINQRGGSFRTEEEDSRAAERVTYRSLSIGPSLSATSSELNLSVALRGGRELFRQVEHVSSSAILTRDKPEPSWIAQVSIAYGESVTSTMGNEIGLR